jgi:hypothetical protein
MQHFTEPPVGYRAPVLTQLISVEFRLRVALLDLDHRAPHSPEVAPVNPADQCSQKGRVWNAKRKNCLPPPNPLTNAGRRAGLGTARAALPPVNPANECRKKGLVWNSRAKICLPPPNPAAECSKKGWTWDGKQCRPPLTNIPKLSLPKPRPPGGTSPKVIVPRHGSERGASEVITLTGGTLDPALLRAPGSSRGAGRRSVVRVLEGAPNPLGAGASAQSPCVMLAYPAAEVDECIAREHALALLAL